MDGMLSQEEINALLGDMGAGSSGGASSGGGGSLNSDEKDAIGEISNICMGTAATTLYSLVNQKVVITTPVVDVTTWDEMTKEHARPCVFININYKEGIDGNNVLILKEEDVKIITDLMMGGDGLNPSPELTDLHISAICEAMNQMMGSSATSLSSMLNCKVDISPPEAELIDMAGNIEPSKISSFINGEFVASVPEDVIAVSVIGNIVFYFELSVRISFFRSVILRFDLKINSSALALILSHRLFISA